MADIKASDVKALRDKTNAGMMDCKAALKEADGDMEEAATILRKKGIAGADKKASRAAKEGVIASRIDAEHKSGVLVEVNCETDFVAKNDNFSAFVGEVLDHVSASDPTDGGAALLSQQFASDSSQTVEDFVKVKMAEMGENILIPRATTYRLGEAGGEHGVIASYIHLQGKIGVLVEVNCASADIASNEVFRTLVSDITLHIAAAQPLCLGRDEVPAELVEKEKEIFREQMKDKPDHVIDKIIGGKIDKYYSSTCLLEQAFVKDPDQSITDLLKAKVAELGGEIEIRRFTRYAVGEEA